MYAIRSYYELLRRPLVPVESFGATMQMVKAGFGDGIVPLGMVMDMDLKRRAYRNNFV